MRYHSRNVRIHLELEDKGQWVKLFNARDMTIFIASDKPPEIGKRVRLDLVVGLGGPKIIFRGKVISRRLQGDDTLPKGCSVALDSDEKAKANYLNGYVRGGFVDLRKNRRVPVRLKVTYGGIPGAVHSYTRDISDVGVFIVTEEPLLEETELHLYIDFPDRPEPLSMTGVVTHTVVVEDEDVPGMGVRFDFQEDVNAEEFSAIVAKLESSFLAGQLPDKYLV